MLLLFANVKLVYRLLLLPCSFSRSIGLRSAKPVTMLGDKVFSKHNLAQLSIIFFSFKYTN